MSLLVPETPLRFDPQRRTDRPGHLKEYMLCQHCEAQFASYEQAASHFLDDLNRTQEHTGTQPIRHSSLDYRNIKLFFLSLLWRCAVCQDRITKSVDLGPHLRLLTTLLERGDPGSENEFPIFLRVLAESREAKNAVLTVPRPVRRATRRGYEMVANGVEISWIVDKRGASKEDVPHVFRPDGSWLISVVRGSNCPVWMQAVATAQEQDCHTTS